MKTLFNRFAIAAVLCLAANSAWAANGTWNTTDGAWGTPTNWVGSVVPDAAGDTANFNGPGGAGRTITLDSNRTVGTLNLGTAFGNYIIATGSPGGSLIFNNSGSNAKLNIGSINFRIITAPVILADSLDISAGGASNSITQISGNITAAGGADATKVITHNAGVGPLSIDGTVSDGGSLRKVSIHQNFANSTLTLTGSNSFTGGVMVSSGTLAAGANPTVTAKQFGEGTITLNGGVLQTLQFNNYAYGNATAVAANSTINFGRSNSGGAAFTYTFGTLSIGNNVLNVNNTGSGSTSLDDTLIFGATTLTGNATFAVDKTSTPNARLTLGALSGVGSLTKTGTGILELSAAGSHTGTTTNSGGLLVLTNAQALKNSALDTTTSIVGTSTAGLKIVPTTLQLGGLIGNKDLASLFTTTAGGYTGVTALTLNPSTGATNSYSGVIANGATGMTLTKTGTGTQVLSGVNTYTGATTVSVGTLVINGTGSINASSGVTINGGTLVYNSSTNLSKAVTFTSGKLGGTNWNGNLSGLTIGTGQTISPGNSPGTAVTVNQTWAGGGTYVWEINNATGTAGADPGWDLLSGSGTLTLSATSGSKFNINVTSLTLLNVAGDAANFNSASTYQWMIADFANAITTFDASAFNIDMTAFTNSPHGTFRIVRGDDISITGGDNTQLYLLVPEPSTAILMGLGLGVTLFGFRRRVRQS